MNITKLRNFIVFVAVCIITWNICDYLYCSFITHNAYHFTAGESVARPLITGILLYGLYYFFPLRKK